jgi:hypothetical protein
MLDETQIARLILSLEAASNALRDAVEFLWQETALAREGVQKVVVIGSAVNRARSMHPELGPRQAQILELLEEAGPSGTTTGLIGKEIEYPQADVYLTLRGLITRGMAEKDETASPQLYRLGERLRVVS